MAFCPQVHQVSGRSVSTRPSPGRSVPSTSPKAWPRPALQTLQMLRPGREIPWSWAPGRWKISVMLPPAIGNGLSIHDDFNMKMCFLQLCYKITEGQTVKHVFWWKSREIPIVFAGSTAFNPMVFESTIVTRKNLRLLQGHGNIWQHHHRCELVLTFLQGKSNLFVFFMGIIVCHLTFKGLGKNLKTCFVGTMFIAWNLRLTPMNLWPHDLIWSDM